MQKLLPPFNKGLTLVESLVAIMILLTAVVAPMTIYAKSIFQARYAGDQITAYYLAQEALEFAKYRVSTSLNDGSSRLLAGEGIDPMVPRTLADCVNVVVDVCRVDVINDTVELCGGNIGACPYLKIDNGVYNHNTGDDTIFKRGVFVEESIDEALITVSVQWERAGISKTISVSDSFFAWR